MKSLALFFLVLPLFYSFAGDKEIIKSTLSDVTVFTSGAQVTRKASYTVKPGMTDLIIEGISPNIDPKSLRVKAIGNVILLDSKYQIYYPQPQEIKLEGLPLKIQKDIQLLQDSIDVMNYEITELNDEIDVLNTSKKILANNGAIKGQGKVNDSIQLLKQAMDYYQLKMNELNKKLQLLNKKNASKRKRLDEMKKRMEDLVNYQSSNSPQIQTGPSHRIIITVQSKEVISGKLQISYLVSGASWLPSYDLRSELAEGKVNLTYKALITQNTGEDWKDIALTLSTNNPYQNKTKPELHPWYLDYYNYGRIDGRLNGYANTPAPAMSDQKAKVPGNLGNEYEDKTIADFTTVIDKMISAEYKIDLPYTIESDGESHLVLVKNVDLKANYRYYTVPKLDAGAYLIAEISNIDNLNIVPGTANIFFDATYMGETYIDPTIMTDTMKLSLGMDPNLVVKRVLQKKELKEKIIGNDVEKTFAYEITVKNLKSTNIDIVIEDQIPITTNGEITIEALNTAKADYDKSTGKLVWKTEVKTKEIKVFSYSFKVKYPKDKPLSIQ